MLPMIKKDKKASKDSCCSNKTDCCGTKTDESSTITCSDTALPQDKGDFHFDYEGNKIHFISLGCPRNLVDSEVMLGILLKAGYEVHRKFARR